AAPARHGRRWARAGAVLVCVIWLVVAPRAGEPASTLPDRISDQQFWQLVTDMSETSGHFPSDNLVSNELTFQWVIPELQRRSGEGRAYLGVGPDQNFTYLASLQPSIAFIVDIRRDNLRLQLMYKALLELSPTRAQFLSRLFSREVPAGLAADAPVERIFEAIEAGTPSQERHNDTLKLIKHHLRVQHGFAISDEDFAGVEYVLTAFFYAGPSLAYSNAGRGRYPTYQDLMSAADQEGQQRSYLANETLYGRLRAMELRNLIIPLVGDFAGPKALRDVGAYLAAHNTVVGTIYTSNVEQYLFQYETWRAYYANVGTLPLDERSTFVRSCFTQCMAPAGSRSVQLLDPVAALLRDVTGGRIASYYDLLTRSTR
ncbi:MAG TPA: hypothetical protein VMZ90_09025, partial [Vicinamibacterales bacterium]|nr:hypothetical protein [Vicinamibacterales bacterium]